MADILGRESEATDRRVQSTSEALPGWLNSAEHSVDTDGIHQQRSCRYTVSVGKTFGC